jgi:hypothetical protein
MTEVVEDYPGVKEQRKIIFKQLKSAFDNKFDDHLKKKGMLYGSSSTTGSTTESQCQDESPQVKF